MTIETTALTQAQLRTPRAAAIAGIVFSILLTTALLLLRTSVPDDPLEEGAWLDANARVIDFALKLIPFAGIAFLWFIGVLRDRLGQREDRFFATVFFGSGILFLATLFVAAAVAGAVVMTFNNRQDQIGSNTFHVGRVLAYIVMNIYAVKMAGVFIVSTSTVALYTRFVSRWIAFLGYGLALLLLLASSQIRSVILVLPLWVLLVSIHILVDTLRRAPPAE